MKAQKKTVEQHKRDGTYQPCRHDKPPRETQDRPIPKWLTAAARAHYVELVDSLAGVDVIDETPVIQVAVLKAQLEDEPELFTVAHHNQLRMLTAMIRDWKPPAGKTVGGGSPFDKFLSRHEAMDDYEAYQAKKRARRPVKG